MSDLPNAARRRADIVIAPELGTHPSRAALRRRLVRLQPGAWVAQTQPVDLAVVLTAARAALAEREHAFLGATALWLHDAGPPPVLVAVGVPAARRAALAPPVWVRRVAPSVLRGSRVRRGFSVVALEVALLQVAGELPYPRVLLTVESVLRDRRTSVVALRARCRRGLRGSAAVRRAIDELVGTSLDGAVRELHRALTARGAGPLRTEVRFTNAGGASCYADLLHEASGTVIEVDGYLSHTERARFRTDRRRDRWLLREHGLRTIRVDVADVLEDVDGLVDELLPLLLADAA